VYKQTQRYDRILLDVDVGSLPLTLIPMVLKALPPNPLLYLSSFFISPSKGTRRNNNNKIKINEIKEKRKNAHSNLGSTIQILKHFFFSSYITENTRRSFCHLFKKKIKGK
jgi:hypothetical protein